MLESIFILSALYQWGVKLKEILLKQQIVSGFNFQGDKVLEAIGTPRFPKGS